MYLGNISTCRIIYNNISTHVEIFTLHIMWKRIIYFFVCLNIKTDDICLYKHKENIEKCGKSEFFFHESEV